MRKKAARLPRHALTGEPDLMSLLSDPMMMTLWRADHIDPEDARRFIASTAERLQHRSAPRRRDGQRAERQAAAEDDQSYAFV